MEANKEIMQQPESIPAAASALAEDPAANENNPNREQAEQKSNSATNESHPFQSENGSAPVLLCRGLSKRYGAKQALENIDLTLPQGKIVGLLGPNGSGKSTLLKLACGLIPPSSGQILIGGNKPGVESKKQISYLPEQSYLNGWMRVSDLVAMFADFYADFHTKAAWEMLENLHINGKDRLKTLSKGTQEKVQLILVMSRRARLYLLDEPIGGVDPAAREYILRTIIKNYDQQSTILISTHLISEVEQILDEAIFLNQGKIVVNAPVDTLREQSGKSLDAMFREVFRC